MSSSSFLSSASSSSSSVPRMRNPLGFVPAGPDGLAAAPHLVHADRQRLPAQHPVAALMTTDTRAPPTHRGAGLGGGANAPYRRRDNEYIFDGEGRKLGKVACPICPVMMQEQTTLPTLPPPVDNEGFVATPRSAAWVSQAREDTREAHNASVMAITAGAVASGMLIVAAVAMA